MNFDGIVEKYFTVSEIEGEPINFGELSYVEDTSMKLGIAYEYATNTIFYNMRELEIQAKELKVGFDDYVESMFCFVLGQANLSDNSWYIAEKLLGNNIPKNLQAIKRINI